MCPEGRLRGERPAARQVDLALEQASGAHHKGVWTGVGAIGRVGFVYVRFGEHAAEGVPDWVASGVAGCPDAAQESTVAPLEEHLAGPR